MSDINVRKMIDDSMVSMAVEFTTLAYLASRVGIYVTDSDERSIAHTNGKGIYINAKVIEAMYDMGTEVNNAGNAINLKLNKQNIIFVIAHELMHMLNNTFERGENIGILPDDFSQLGKVKNELWNIATDFEINSLLKNNTKTSASGSKSSLPIGQMPEFGCYDDKYIDWPAEKIYEDLYKQAEQNGFESVSAGGQQFTFDDQDDSDGQSDSDDDSDGNSNGNGNSNNGSGKGKKKDKQSNGLTYGLDEHKPYADAMTKDEVMAKISDVLGNSGLNGDGIGTGMSAFDRGLDIMFKPQPFNWRRALTRYMKSFMKDNYTWNKPSRAGIANGLILPSTSTTPKLHVAVAVDTSGSIGNPELELLMNHVFTILSQFKHFTVDLWCCSTHVHEDTFTTYTASNKSKLSEFKIQSDGGTDMSKNLEFIDKKYAGNKPDVVMIFTDGYDSLSGDTETRTPYPIVWLIVDNKAFVKPAHIPGAVYPFETH